MVADIERLPFSKYLDQLSYIPKKNKLKYIQKASTIGTRMVKKRGALKRSDTFRNLIAAFSIFCSYYNENLLIHIKECLKAFY